MSEIEPAWIVHRFYGPPELVEAFRQSLAEREDIGAVVPPYDGPLRALDGLAAISFTSTTNIPCPEGLFNDRPETVTALQGHL